MLLDGVHMAGGGGDPPGRTSTDESRPRGGFTLAANLVLAGTAGDNGNAGGSLNQPVI